MRVRNHVNPLTIRHRFELLDLKNSFPSFNGIVDFEIGFGRGVFLRHYATLFPERSFVGIEVRKTMVDILASRLKDDYSNVELVFGDGIIGLEDLFLPNTLSNIFVFHPDPWFKTRHFKRRVVSEKFLELALSKLVDKGKIYLSTDQPVLWNAIQTVFNNNKHFKLIEDSYFWGSIYCSHWHDYSLQDKRSLFYGVYQKCNV